MIFFLVCFHLGAYAQSIDRRLKINLNELNMSFNMPNNYIELDSGFHFVCWDGKMASDPIYTVVKKDSSVLIAYSIIFHGKQDDIKRIQRINPEWTSVINFKNIVKNLADTINHKVNHYDSIYLKNTSSADMGCEFSRNCVVPFREKYINNRIVIIGKNDGRQVQIIYLFTDMAKEKMEAEIKNTANNLKFND